MKFILGLSGTHGTGKSTILNGVSAAGYEVDFSQLSRSAQAALRWDRLSRAEESEENMWALQEAILGAMWDRDQAIIKSGRVTLVERSPADAWAYTLLWLHRLNLGVDSRQAISYRNRCRDMATNYAKFILVRPESAIPFVAESARADEQSRNFVDSALSLFIQGGELPHHIIESVGADARIAEVGMLFSLSKMRFSYA